MIEDKFRPLDDLDGQVARRGALQNLVHLHGHAWQSIKNGGSVGNQASRIRDCPAPYEHCGEAMCGRKLGDLLAEGDGHGPSSTPSALEPSFFIAARAPSRSSFGPLMLIV